MALALRFYLFEENGRIRRLPYTKYNALKNGEITIPGYATKSVRMAEVVLNLVNRKPESIVRIVGNTLYFDAEGSFKKDYSHHFDLVTKNISYLLSVDEPKSKIINAENLFTEKTLNDKYYWNLTSKDITRLVETIWATKAKKKPKQPKLRLVKS